MIGKSARGVIGRPNHADRQSIAVACLRDLREGGAFFVAHAAQARETRVPKLGATRMRHRPPFVNPHGAPIIAHNVGRDDQAVGNFERCLQDAGLGNCRRIGRRRSGSDGGSLRRHQFEAGPVEQRFDRIRDFVHSLGELKDQTAVARHALRHAAGRVEGIRVRRQRWNRLRIRRRRRDRRGLEVRFFDDVLRGESGDFGMPARCVFRAPAWAGCVWRCRA